jgi:hypothetical protein
MGEDQRVRDQADQGIHQAVTKTDLPVRNGVKDFWGPPAIR